MIRITIFAALLGLAACGPQAKLDDGFNPYATGPGPVAAPPVKP